MVVGVANSLEQLASSSRLLARVGYKNPLFETAGGRALDCGKRDWGREESTWGNSRNQTRQCREIQDAADWPRSTR